MKILKLLPLAFLLFGIADLNAQKDYRLFQTPVKNQGYRGTCTAFGLAAAIEVMPGMPADISEQYLYASLKLDQDDVPYKEGDLLRNYQGSIPRYGFVPEEVLPYNPKSSDWQSADDNFTALIRGAQMGKVGLMLSQNKASYTIPENGFIYYGPGNVNDVNTIKELLDLGFTAIAVSYKYLHIPAWSRYSGNPETPLLPTILIEYNGQKTRYMDLVKTYEGNLIEDAYSGKVPYYLENPKTKLEDGTIRDNYGAHIVTIVGYNDKGFIFKNSWGSGWGDKGYGYISYAAHRIMAQEAIIPRNLALDYPAVFKPMTQNVDMKLKTSIFNTQQDMQFAVSMVYPSDQEAMDVQQVDYEFYNGKHELLAKTTAVKDTTQIPFITYPFKGKLTPPDFLLGKAAIYAKVTLTGTNGIQAKRTYANIFIGTDDYTALENTTNTLKVSPVYETFFKELFPLQDSNIGFMLDASAFHTSLKKSGLPYSTNASKNQFYVSFQDKPFQNMLFKFDVSDDNLLAEAELVFKTPDEAKAYFLKHYKVQDDGKFKYFKDEYNTQSFFADEDPKKAKAWYYNNKIFLVCKYGRWTNI